MLKKISESRHGDPSFESSWSTTSSNGILSHPAFGVIEHVVACGRNGEARFDFPLWLERTGAVGVPIDRDGSVCLLRNFRHAVAPPRQRGVIPIDNLDGLGQSSLELPRGFAEPDESPDETARREVEEETGFEVEELTLLGATNANTTYFAFSHHVYLAKIDTKKHKRRRVVDNERIEEVLLMPLSEVLDRVASGEIFCGMTQAALTSYLAWREKGSAGR